MRRQVVKARFQHWLFDRHCRSSTPDSSALGIESCPFKHQFRFEHTRFKLGVLGRSFPWACCGGAGFRVTSLSSNTSSIIDIPQNACEDTPGCLLLGGHGGLLSVRSVFISGPTFSSHRCDMFLRSRSDRSLRPKLGGRKRLLFRTVS